jgi:uncharacterized protein YhfF
MLHKAIELLEQALVIDIARLAIAEGEGNASLQSWEAIMKSWR